MKGTSNRYTVRSMLWRDIAHALTYYEIPKLSRGPLSWLPMQPDLESIVYHKIRDELRK